MTSSQSSPPFFEVMSYMDALKGIYLERQTMKNLETYMYVGIGGIYKWRHTNVSYVFTPYYLLHIIYCS